MILVILVMASLLPSASGGTMVVVQDRFASGERDVELTFEHSLTNKSLGVELPRGAQILSANVTVQGILSPAGDVITRDFGTTSIGGNLWAAYKTSANVYPLKVVPYNIPWTPMPSSEATNLSAIDDKYWHTQTPTDPEDPPYEYPVQLFHFKLPVRDAISYEVTWVGNGSCMANTSMPYWVKVYAYEFNGSRWDERFSQTCTNPNTNGTAEWSGGFTDRIPAVNDANGSMVFAVVGHHADVDAANSTTDRGHIRTDYIGINATITPGQPKYPKDVVMSVGDTDIQLSTGDLEGYVVVNEALGFRQALQDELDSQPPGTGNVTLDLEFRVSELTKGRVGVADLDITYRIQDPGDNLPPVWVGPSHVYLEEDSDWTPVLDLDAAFTDDFDQGSLDFEVEGISVHTSLEARIRSGLTGNQTLELKPVGDFNGETYVVLNATDRWGAWTRSPGLVVSVEPVPDAPVLQDPGSHRVDERQSFSVTLIATDVDLPHDNLTFSDTSEFFDVDPLTGVIEWTPTANHVGELRCTVTVTDDDGLTDTKWLVIEVVNVDDPPVLTIPTSAEAVQDEEFQLQLTAEDPDVPYGDSLTFSAASPSLSFEFEPGSGYLWFTPGNTDIGTHVLTVSVVDSSGARDEGTMEIIVANVNDRPEISPPTTTAYQQGEAVSVRLVVVDIDLGLDLDEPEALTITADGPAWLAPDADGWVNFTADQSMVGEHLVTYTVTDSGGLSDSVDVVWKVLDVNDAPTITTAVGDTVQALEDEEFTMTFEAEDIEGDPLSWSDDTPLFGIGMAGEVSFTPGQADVGTHTVTVTVSDGRGGSASLTFDLVVVNVNDAPDIVSVGPANGTRFDEGKAVTFTVEAEDEDGDALTYTWKEGDKELGAGSPLVLKDLGPGLHTITVMVSDGDEVTEQSLDIEIMEVDDGGSGASWTLAAVAIAVIAVVVIALFLYMRSRKGE